MRKSLKRKFKQLLIKLLRLNNTPAEIALGVAIGVFIAIMPLYGLHTVMVIIAALLVRQANKIAILVGTNISLPPTLPFITWAGYEIGKLILRNNSASLHWSDFKKITFQKIIDIYPALFVGSIVLGLFCAVIFYFLAFYFVKKFEARKTKGLKEQSGLNPLI